MSQFTCNKHLFTVTEHVKVIIKATQKTMPAM